jgi:hypothetical protein
MNFRHRQADRFILTVGFVVFLIVPIGCGAVGPPIPPEDIGIEAKIRKQERANAQSEGPLSQDLEAPVEEETVKLPSFYPIGTR